MNEKKYLAKIIARDANGLQVLRDRFGFIDTPCTTKDSDHPALKTVKAVCEGVGLGIPIEGTIRAIGRVRGKQKITNNPTNDVLKKVDAIQSGKLLKAERAAKVVVERNLRDATRKKLFNKGIDFDKLKPESKDYHSRFKGEGLWNAMVPVWKETKKNNSSVVSKLEVIVKKTYNKIEKIFDLD